MKILYCLQSSVSRVLNKQKTNIIEDLEWMSQTEPGRERERTKRRNYYLEFFIHFRYFNMNKYYLFI